MFRLYKGIIYFFTGGIFTDWEWVDGTAVDYFNWNEGEPNNNDDLPYCAEIYKDWGTWNDLVCNLYNGYICKARKSTV